MKIKNFLTTPIISSLLSADDYHFLSEYRENASKIDNHYIKLYGSLSIDDELIGENDTQTKTNVTNEINAYLITHKEQLNRIYDINNLQYNPLYNVDVLRTHTYSDFETDMTYGQNKTTNKYGEQNTTDVIGEVSINDTIGGGNDQHILGDTDSTTTNLTTGYNGNTMLNDNQSHIQSEEVINNDIYADRYNSSVTDERTNTNKIDEHTDTITNDAHNDKKLEKEHTITELFQGNQGITMSTQLIQSELDTWSNIAFFDILFKSLFATICIPMYD